MVVVGGKFIKKLEACVGEHDESSFRRQDAIAVPKGSLIDDTGFHRPMKLGMCNAPLLPSAHQGDFLIVEPKDLAAPLLPTPTN